MRKCLYDVFSVIKQCLIKVFSGKFENTNIKNI